MTLPHGFVYLKEVDASILQDIKYYTGDNFMGRRIVGYEAPECVLTQVTAEALSKLQKQLRQQSLGLKVFDGYRPQRAVDDFVTWMQDIQDQKMKEVYYPRVDKSDFVKLGYVAAKSAHTRGSTVDLTLIHLSDMTELPMGTHFDFMDEKSHTLSPDISPEAQTNRLLFKKLMEDAGFVPYEKEWWHFTFKDETFPETYFDFSIK